MRITLIGHGRMGRAVERLAADKGHRVVHVIEQDRPLHSRQQEDWMTETDVLVDFSTAEAVPENVRGAVRLGLPIVEGTTGWDERLPEVRETVLSGNGTCVYAANFSLGVQLFYAAVRKAGTLFSRFSEYQPFLHETHHSSKTDAPSGTALALLRLLREGGEGEVPASSLRAGYFPGTHTVGFDSTVDTVVLTHTARSRDGFALGALLAAERIRGRRGFIPFENLLFGDGDD